MKKILALLLCIPFVLLACVSCGNADANSSNETTASTDTVTPATPDYSKIRIPIENYANAPVVAVENKEQFEEYYGIYMENIQLAGRAYCSIDVVCEDRDAISDDEFAHLNYRDITRLQYSREDRITIDIDFENVALDAIAELTANENITEIVFLFTEFEYSVPT